MRYLTYQLGHKTSAGVIQGTFVYDLAQAFFMTFRRPYKFRDMLEFLEADGIEKIKEVDFGALRDDRTVVIPLREIKLRAPILRPPKIVCVGLNYKDHAAEQKIDPPTAPVLFAKAANTIVGPDDEVIIPREISERVDHEVELGVVIGRPGFKIARAEALAHVLGYTVFNDVTARDIQRGDKQWFRGKSFHTFSPMGPHIVTPDEVRVEALELSLKVNGEERQRGNTRQLIFDVPYLIEYISACFPLEAGDLIATGTPSGVGVFRTPPVFLNTGDRMEASIDGIGTLTNTLK